MLITQGKIPITKKNDKDSLLSNEHDIFVQVFHRILDFKSGVHFYAAPFFAFIPACPDDNM